jgi:hypothetical protein
MSVTLGILSKVERRGGPHVTEHPALSVMVATIRGWPDTRLPIDATREQLARIDGELIVVDGSHRPAPPAEDIGERVRWISRPGESVFQLRMAGYAACSADIVAVTEDHCAPADDWCERILAAHAAHPDAVAIGGAVENGTTEHLVDWATFIVTQSPFVPPLANGPTERIAGAATTSYKRRALERRPDHGSFGAIELFDAAMMRAPGEVLLNDDSIRIRHHQSMGFAGTTASQFDNGRTIAGFRRLTMSRGDWLRIAGFPVLPLYRAARSAWTAWGRRIPRPVIAVTLPLTIFLHYAQTAGELVGYLAGPGDSPRRLR